MSSNNRLGVEGSNPYSPRYKASVPTNELPCQVHVTIYSYTCKLRVYTQSLTQENLKSAFLRTLASISGLVCTDQGVSTIESTAQSVSQSRTLHSRRIWRQTTGRIDAFMEAYMEAYMSRQVHWHTEIEAHRQNVNHFHSTSSLYKRIGDCPL